MWVTLGQAPDLVRARSLLHLQVTGAVSDDVDSEGAKEMLSIAMRGKAVLLILNDIWDVEHEHEHEHVSYTFNYSMNYISFTSFNSTPANTVPIWDKSLNRGGRCTESRCCVGLSHHHIA